MVTKNISKYKPIIFKSFAEILTLFIEIVNKNKNFNLELFTEENKGCEAEKVFIEKGEELINLLLLFQPTHFSVKLSKKGFETEIYYIHKLNRLSIVENEESFHIKDPENEEDLYSYLLKMKASGT